MEVSKTESLSSLVTQKSPTFLQEYLFYGGGYIWTIPATTEELLLPLWSGMTPGCDQDLGLWGETRGRPCAKKVPVLSLRHSMNRIFYVYKLSSVTLLLASFSLSSFTVVVCLYI